jgi:hypothetical protein
MAVAFDAKGTSDKTAGATTSLTFTNLTIGAVSNPALLVFVQFGGDPGAFTKQQWDSTGTPQTLTNIISAHETDSLAYAFLFGLAGPHTGNKTLALTWTNSIDYTIDAASFSGADQTGGATTFKNATSATGPSTPGTITVTSPAGDMAVASFASNNATWSTASAGTLIFADNTNVSGAATYLAGAGSTTMTVNQGGADIWVAVGCDIAAFVAAATPVLSLSRRVFVKRRWSGWRQSPFGAFPERRERPALWTPRKSLITPRKRLIGAA